MRIVKRIEFGNIIVDLQKAESIIKRDELIPRENIKVGDRIDIATVGAIRYARSLKPRNINAVHFVIDDKRAEELNRSWQENPAFADVSLELIDCPDRRLVNSVVDYAQTVTAAEDVELTLLLPRRAYSKFLGRLLHDQTAESIAGPISQIPRVVATIIPFDVQKIIAGQESFSNSTTFQMPVAAEPKRLTPTTTCSPDSMRRVRSAIEDTRRPLSSSTDSNAPPRSRISCNSAQAASRNSAVRASTTCEPVKMSSYSSKSVSYASTCCMRNDHC